LDKGVDPDAIVVWKSSEIFLKELIDINYGSVNYKKLCKKLQVTEQKYLEL